MIPILLTASVDTRGMRGAKFSALERESMYVDTLNYYISYFSKYKESFTLIFAENSGWNELSIRSKLKIADNVYVEYIALSPNKFDISKGKSYNEMLMLDLVTESNETIRKAGIFFKLTGRFPIKNLYRLLKEVDKRNSGGQLIFIKIAKTTLFTNGCTCLLMVMQQNVDIMRLILLSMISGYVVNTKLLTIMKEIA